MKPVKFLEHVRTYPNSTYRVEWGTGSEPVFSSLNAAVEYMQANCAKRKTLMREKRLSDPRIAISRNLPAKYVRDGQEFYVHIDGSTYGESMAYAENAQRRWIEFSQDIDEVYQERFRLNLPWSGVDFNFDYGYMFGDYPEYEVGEKVMTTYEGRRQMVEIYSKFDRSRLSDERFYASDPVYIGYLTEGGEFGHTAPVATFSRGSSFFGL